MLQVKAGDTVRIKTAEELAAIGTCFSDCSGDYAETAGTRHRVEKVFDGLNGSVMLENGTIWVHNEYVLLPEIPERGEEVYVSGKSAEGALKNKEVRIFLAYIEGARFPFITVSAGYEDKYKNGEQFDAVMWSYAVKKPALKKITKDELPAFLADNGYELEE